MQALVKRAAGPGLELCDVPEPPMSINDVRIRVRRTGICGTDLHIADWDAWAERTIEPPLVVGHEFVGEVLEVGSNVKDIAPGDIVSGEGHVVCGRCRHCRAGRWHLCAKTVGLELKDLDNFPTPEDGPEYYVDFDETGPFEVQVGESECAA